MRDLMAFVVKVNLDYQFFPTALTADLLQSTQIVHNTRGKMYLKNILYSRLSESETHWNQQQQTQQQTQQQ